MTINLDNLGRAIALESYFQADLEDRLKDDLPFVNRERWVNVCRDGAYLVCKADPEETRSVEWKEWLWALDVELYSIW